MQLFSAPGHVRIIGGRLRGKHLFFQPSEGLRPTPDRVRETVFNWFQKDILDAVCLDGFAGTGAFGFEALSRGATSAVLVEMNPGVVTSLKKNRDQMKFSQEAVRIVQSSLFDFLETAPVTPFDLVFLDPPFHQGLLVPAVTLLLQRAWLSPRAKLYFECEREYLIEADRLLLSEWVLQKHHTAGQVTYGYWVRR